MKLIPCDLKEIKKKRSYSDNQSIIKEFLEMNMRCVKYEGYPHKSATVCAGCMRNSANRMGCHTVKFMARGDEVYMVRTDLNDEV